MTTPTERRRSLYAKLASKSGLELRLLSRLLVILAGSFALFVTLAVTMPAAVGFLGGSPRSGITELLSRIDLLAFGVILPLACTLLGLLGLGLRETLRIAGPDYRIREVARRLQELCVPRGLRIRNGDYLQSTAKELNVALERLHDEVKTLREIVVRGDAAEAPREARAILDELKARLESFSLVTCAPECRPVEVAASAVARAPVEPPVEPIVELALR